MNKQFCFNTKEYARFNTRIVNIGELPLGGNNPIRVQSMTNTDTQDVKKTVEQSIRMINAGCEYVRITVPSINEIDSIKEIKKTLRNKGCKNPIIADVHFNPKVAEEAAKICEKVRINPGNYVDKKAFKTHSYTEQEYKNELERISERVKPLLMICKEYGTALRIGTNHGSLSDRIISRFGDTPVGMVESALEFIQIFEDFGFYNIVLSMKSSNVRVMVQAYRLLVNRMIERKLNYPIHLGVTEAGYGDNGRIKSFAGIASLLNDGIGDTIRVSLTEAPEEELKPALMLSNYFNKKESSVGKSENDLFYNPLEYNRRESFLFNDNIGASNPPIIINDSKPQTNLLNADYFYDTSINCISRINNCCEIAGDPLKIINNADPLQLFDKSSLFLSLSDNSFDFDKWSSIKSSKSIAFVLEHQIHGFHNTRNFINKLVSYDLKNPIIICANYDHLNKEDLIFFASAELGPLLIDGLLDGIWIKSSNKDLSNDDTIEISFKLLQATRARIYTAELISCPTCGRTQYDLSKVLLQLELLKKHLNGLKIAVMGCVVNGPGEMADADYGYVGAGNGKVNLYKGKTLIKKLIDESDAINELITMIKTNGDWKE